MCSNAYPIGYIFRVRRRAELLPLFNHLPECAIELLTKITANGVSRRRNYLQRAALYRRRRCRRRLRTVKSALLHAAEG